MRNDRKRMQKQSSDFFFRLTRFSVSSAYNFSAKTMDEKKKLFEFSILGFFLE